MVFSTGGFHENAPKNLHKSALPGGENEFLQRFIRSRWIRFNGNSAGPQFEWGGDSETVWHRVPIDPIGVGPRQIQAAGCSCRRRTAEAKDGMDRPRGTGWAKMSFPTWNHHKSFLRPAVICRSYGERRYHGGLCCRYERLNEVILIPPSFSLSLSPIVSVSSYSSLTLPPPFLSFVCFWKNAYDVNLRWLKLPSSLSKISRVTM